MKKVFTGYFHKGWYKRQHLRWIKDMKITKLSMPDLIKHKAIITENSILGYAYPVKVKITIEAFKEN
jgi:hypothetical protein